MSGYQGFTGDELGTVMPLPADTLDAARAYVLRHGGEDVLTALGLEVAS